MKRFKQSELKAALDHSAAGGQALHCHRFITSRAPQCFKRDVKTGKDIGHLFDLDRERLLKTSKRLGVRVLYVDREGERSQHIDLCGGPMAKALRECGS